MPKRKKCPECMNGEVYLGLWKDGKSHSEPCPTCHGTGYVPVKKKKEAI